MYTHNFETPPSVQNDDQFEKSWTLPISKYPETEKVKMNENENFFIYICLFEFWNFQREVLHRHESLAPMHAYPMRNPLHPRFLRPLFKSVASGHCGRSLGKILAPQKIPSDCREQWAKIQRFFSSTFRGVVACNATAWFFSNPTFQAKAHAARDM